MLEKAKSKLAYKKLWDTIKLIVMEIAFTIIRPKSIIVALNKNKYISKIFSKVKLLIS